MGSTRSLGRSMAFNPYQRSQAGPTRRLRGVEPLEERALLAVLTVMNTNPSGPDSLAAAITTANDPLSNPGHDTIQFAKGVRGEIVLGSELVITDDLTIRGPGADKLTISGGDTSRIFSVLSADLADPISVDIQRLEIAHGLASDAPGFPPEFGFAFGGGIYNLGSEVSLDRVRMVSNVASGALGAGGAIANEFGGTLIVTHSELHDNTATGILIASGGAITYDIGPSLDGDGTPGQPVINISHSNFSNNRAIALVADPSVAGDFAPFAGFAFGGAVSNLAGNATITHSHFDNNSVEGGSGASGNPGGFANGGAIYSDDFSPFDGVPPVLGRDSSLTVSHSTFDGNGSTGGVGDTGLPGGVAAGGAISVSIAFLEEAANIQHSLFVHNTATGGAGGAEGGAGGAALGGALSVLAGAEVSVANSRFSHNTAQGGDGAAGGDGGSGTGGAIGLGRIVTAVPTPLEGLLPSLAIRRSSITHNAARGGAGGDGGNGGNGNGGGLGVTQGASANVVGALIVRNQAVGGAGGADGNGGNGQGGGVYNSGSNTSLARTSVFLNYAKAGAAGAGGADGQGLGGGLFNTDEDDLLGTLSVDRLTRLLTRFNHADDAGDNVFGDLS